MDFIELLRDLGVFGLAMWFIQHLLSKSAARKFETYKTELSHQTLEFQSRLDNRMEQYRAELNFQNYKSTKIYEQQLNVIIDLFRKLEQLNVEMQIMTAPMKRIYNDGDKEESDRINKAGEAYNEFINFYRDNLIFIPSRTAQKLDTVREDIWKSFKDYTFERETGISGVESYKRFQEAGARVREKIEPAIKQLRADFKELIGVENNEPLDS